MGEGLEQDSSRRRRAFKPKTRTGCITCRIRRIKCDEGKPSCHKCTSTGRKCDGYIVATNDRKGQPTKELTPTLNNAVLDPALPQMAVVPFQGTKSEQRAFHYFQQETVPQICGFYRSQFWFQSVLQACHHNPAIRHAAIALGALHEQYGSAAPPTAMTKHREDLIAGGFALQQYNKAIHALVEPAAGTLRKPQQRVDVALITCILFACFDALRGHLGTVFDHIDGGVKILSEIQSKNADSTSNSTLYAPISTLQVLFTRLDIQGSAMLGSRHLGLIPKSNRGPVAENLKIPIIFRGFEEARDLQDSIYRCWHHDFRRSLTNLAELPWFSTEDGNSTFTSEENLRDLRVKYTEKIQDWSDAYERFLVANPEKRNLPTDHMLQLWRVYILMHADLDHAAAIEDDTTWDQYTPRFKEMTSHASAVIASASSITRTKPIFSLDTHIISPLYFAASRCRHPIVRREAIACLFTANRQEGLWESRTIARVATRVMEIEEDGIDILIDGTEIPGWKRISDVHPVLDSDGRRAVIHYNLKPMVDGSGPVTVVKEMMEW
ncbi:hypothetical protein EG329_013283 [Mollisiaceae sp. DMI_Dod_QoI]|nr:hypothetical protein EG329_013283 [Helotiales sp. DMI_Dod_QoI]